MDELGGIVDFAVIGAGIAGTSVAAELAGHGRVALIEMESQPGYHTTGRSAAMFAPGYGPQPIRALTRASADFFNNPPAGFTDTPLLSRRDVVMLARPDQLDILDGLISELSQETNVRRLGIAELKQRHPLIREDFAEAGMLDESGSDIDVHALHQGFLKTFRERGGSLLTGTEVSDLRRNGDVWQISSSSGEVSAAIVINAAGAWAEKIGAMAGAETVGLVPKRRTALMIDPPEGLDVDALPLVVDIEENFYMKPDAGRLLISPANEDPMEPCDVQPEELDIAICIDRIQTAFNIEIRRIGNKWAGLRSFVADKSPVAGFSRRAQGFFWLAGQGGYGIQSSPGLSRTAAALAMGNDVPDDILAQGFDPASLAPDRPGLHP